MRFRKNNTESVGIIVPTNLKYAPYVQYYIDILTKNNINFHILCWNRVGLEEKGIHFSYNYKVKDSNRKKMFWGYIKFVQSCKKYIKKNGITKLLILTAAPAFFLGINFLNQFSGKYILDIRDDSPLIRYFPKRFKKICDMAEHIVVSSHKFNEWIPNETLLCHNADINQIEKYLNIPIKKQFSIPISIAFAGMMIESDINIKMLQSLGNDERFKFWYIGKSNGGKERIVKFVNSEDIKNVEFQGTYNKEDINDIYKEKADLINIIRAKTTVNKNALPNKLYDAVIAGVPILVFDHNEAIADYVKKYNLGIVLEENMETIGDTIFNTIHNFNYDDYQQGRLDFLLQVCNDMEVFREMVLSFFK